MIQIDRTEIAAWGKRQEPKGDFPLLIAKLIFETTPRNTFFEIPSGSAVFLDDWDGIVKCELETNYVPDGISVWELKTEGGKTQADSDYEKRTNDISIFDKSKATFIFVTSKTWKGKKKWIEDRLQENLWRDVRVYDAVNLSNWLNITEIAFKWFTGQLGRNYNCLTIEEFWESWSIGPKINGKHIILHPKTVTVGREIESQRLIDYLNGEPDLLVVRGSTKDEAIAFIIATAMLTSQQFYVKFLSKGLVIENLLDFRLIKKSRFNLNLIAKFEDRSELFSAVSRQHHIMLPLGPDDSFTTQNIISLPLLDRYGQVQSLIDSGLSEEEATRFSKEAARDITILKRLIGFELNKAKWQFAEEIDQLIPALLIGRWDESKKGDLIIIERLSGESYDSYSEKLFKWLKVESPPLIKIGSSWRLTSPLDAWTYLSYHLSANNFETLKNCFIEVMGEINPSFDLEPNQRSMASLRGKVSSFSAWCREGLTQSLILVGLHGDKLRFQHSFSAQNWVDGIIKELLYEASGDLWASRNHEMPLIAEASPKSFFESAYHSLSLDDKPLMKMFIEEDDFISPISHHTGLLWALEGLAWTEEYFFDALILLARLVSLDPGGKLANRPMNSLQEILKPWHYQTLAPFENRMKILDLIIKTEYETGWSLLISMLPEGYSTAFPIHKLRWRLFDHSFEQKYTLQEIFDTYSHIINILIEYFDFSEKKMIDLLKKTQSRQIKPSERGKIMSFIESNLDRVEIKNNIVWHELRNILAQHRSFHDAAWALPEIELKQYEVIYNKLEPTDPIDKVIWMFNEQFPNFPDGIERKELSFTEREKLVEEKRNEGLRSIYEKYGFEKVKSLVQTVKEKWIYGDTLAQIIFEDHEILALCEFLKSTEKSILQFIQSFIYRKSVIFGIEWVFELYEKLKVADFTYIQLARIFSQVGQTMEIWEFISKTSKETEINYWKEIYPQFWRLSAEDVIFGIDKLMGVERYISALEIAYHDPQKITSEKLIEVLKNAGSLESLENTRFDSYHVFKLIKDLESREGINKTDLLHIEWLYIPFLSSYGSNHRPTYLHEELANNPAFFIEVLTWVYQSDKEEKGDENISDEIKQIRARNGYELLHFWKKLPGVDENGNIDENYLSSWINKARELAEQVGRLMVADLHIGQILAQYPENKVPWPPKEICQIIESINTESIKSGFSTATFNKRGSSVRGPFDGGEIERGHAKYFLSQADQIKFDFPVIADLLIRLAIGYEHEAKRMDEMAERDELDT